MNRRLPAIDNIPNKPPWLYPIQTIRQGQLYAMAKPESDSLDANIAALKNTRIDSVICLLEETESQALGLSQEETICRSHRIAFTRFAIRDYGVPENSLIKPFIESLYTDLLNGSHTVIHCRGGIGRTGMVCCWVLMMAGYTAADAIIEVSEKRGCNVPETPEQRAAIINFLACQENPLR